MGRYNRVNLDGLQDIVSAPATAATKAGTVVNLVAGKFANATAGLLRAYAVHTADTATDVDTTIALGANINGDKIVTGRTFALRLAVSQTVAKDAELFVTTGGLLTTTGTAGAGMFWANEALTTGAGENFLISVTAK